MLKFVVHIDTYIYIHVNTHNSINNAYICMCVYIYIHIAVRLAGALAGFHVCLTECSRWFLLDCMLALTGGLGDPCTQARQNTGLVLQH